MPQRFTNIWFRYLITDWVVTERPELAGEPFVLAAPERGRMIVKAASPKAIESGIDMGMVVADARALYPALEVIDDQPDKAKELLIALAEWCIRYTPVVSIDLPDGLMLDITGCAHLWGGERAYLKDMIVRLRQKGYYVSAAISDTVGSAWAVAHYGHDKRIVQPDRISDALLPLSPAALRLEMAVVERMHKLGFYQIRNFINMPRSVLRRRFGQQLLDRVDQAFGHAIEVIEPIKPAVPYQERLPCMEPIVTATGIQIALRRLLETLCRRLVKEGKGLRTAVFKGFRVDGKIIQIDIVTNRGSFHIGHLFKLFELKISTMEPALGIELFLLEAPVTEDVNAVQEKLWNTNAGQDNVNLIELLDRVAGKAGIKTIHRYLPDEHYWPERSVKIAGSLLEKPETTWRIDRPRPITLLANPQLIDVSAPLPDYPPLLFRYKGVVHYVKRADGPERIEREWWLEQGMHRDYYCVEDPEGARFWIFRLGHYDKTGSKWFIHGFFA
ncbi:DNA polymerase Y family protein [Dyadobacter sp. LJ53]|uniref:Y-family DNA polymerase n=1 Tax=Dyadobacter chenwenxiniae TaxID=2906456 RepID=UPI001F4202A0|nr:DNA polymerase Y family protein [Dyadobacter chenwenxiniae]MCF0052158.1 DNA polymerase Y family protein [Dyadobacter chenwenxiniae]